jgi:hypothetical protein
MDDSHKMIAGRQLRGTPHEVEGLLVEARFAKDKTIIGRYGPRGTAAIK